MKMSGESDILTWRDGFRIVDLGELARQMYCKHCKSLLDLNQTEKETKMGLASILTVVCHCGCNNDIHTAKQKNTEGTSLVHTINISATISIMRCTLTCDIVHLFLTSLGIPLPSADKLGEYFPSLLSSPLDADEITPDNRQLKPCHNESLGEREAKETLAQEVDLDHSHQTCSSGQAHSKKLSLTIERSIKSPVCFKSTKSTDVLVSNLDLLKNLKNVEPVSNSMISCLLSSGEQHINSVQKQGRESSTDASLPSSTSKHKKLSRALKQRESWPKTKTTRKDPPNKPHKCEQCDAAFKAPSSLKVHMRIHTGERPYICNDCGATFVQAGGLMSHRRRHTGERPYMCDVCGFTCLQPDGLRKHVRIHTGERPFKCESCGAAFKQSSNLIVHKRIHTGERPFVCEQCGKSFACASTLIGHGYSHISDKQFACDWCNKRFKKIKDLKIHKKKTCRAKKKLSDNLGGNSSVSTELGESSSNKQEVWEDGCLP